MSDSYLNNVNLGDNLPEWETQLGLVHWYEGRSTSPEVERKLDSMLGACELGTSVAPLDSIFCSSSYYDIRSRQHVPSMVGNFWPRNRGWKLTGQTDHMMEEFKIADAFHLDRMLPANLLAKKKKLVRKICNNPKKANGDPADMPSNYVYFITQELRRKYNPDLSLLKMGDMRTMDVSQHDSSCTWVKDNGGVIFPGTLYQVIYSDGGDTATFRLISDHDRNFIPMVDQLGDDGVRRSEVLEFSRSGIINPENRGAGLTLATTSYVDEKLNNIFKKDSFVTLYKEKCTWLMYFNGIDAAPRLPEYSDIKSEFDSNVKTLLSPAYYTETGTAPFDPTATWENLKASLWGQATVQAANRWKNQVSGRDQTDRHGNPLNQEDARLFAFAKRFRTEHKAVEPRYTGTFQNVCVTSDDDAMEYDKGPAHFAKAAKNFDSQHFFEIQMVLINILSDEMVNQKDHRGYQPDHGNWDPATGRVRVPTTFAHFFNHPIDFIKIPSLKANGLKHDPGRVFAVENGKHRWISDMTIVFMKSRGGSSADDGGSTTWDHFAVVEELRDAFSNIKTNNQPYKYQHQLDGKAGGSYSIPHLNAVALNNNKIPFGKSTDELVGNINKHVIPGNQKLKDVMTKFDHLLGKLAPAAEMQADNINMKYGAWLAMKDRPVGQNEQILSDLLDWGGHHAASLTEDAADSVLESARELWESATTDPWGKPKPYKYARLGQREQDFLKGPKTR